MQYSNFPCDQYFCSYHLFQSDSNDSKDLVFILNNRITELEATVIQAVEEKGVTELRLEESEKALAVAMATIAAAKQVSSF